MYRLHRLSFFFLVTTLVLALVGCDGGCGGEAKIPAKAIDRVEDIGQKLPKNTEITVYLADLKDTRAAVNNLKARLPDTGPIDGLQKQFQANFGIDLLDRESWKRAGVAPDSSAAIAIYRSRIVFMTYVENRQQFEKIMTDKAKAAFQIQAVTKNEKVGGHSMKVLSDDPGKQLAWLYQGKMAMVVMPATSVDGALEKGTASLVLADIAGTKKPESLAATTGHQAFVKNTAKDYPISMFVNPSAYIASPEFQKQAGEDPTLASGAKWSNDNLDYAALGFKAEKEAAQIRAFVGMKDEFKKSALAAAKPAGTIDWNGFATDKVLLGLRVSVDWGKVWELFTKNMPDDERRTLLRNLKQAGQGLNLDMEKDVFEQLTGNLGLFFYGIGGGLKGMQMDPAAISQNAGILLAVQFKTPEAVESLGSKVMSRLAMMASLRPLSLDGTPQEDWKVIEFTNPPQLGRFYLHKDMVLFGTMAFSEKSVYEYATNKRQEPRLKDNEALDKGKNFAVSKDFTGLYFNSERARDNLGAMLFMLPEAKFLNEIEEASLKFGVNDDGGFAVLDLDLTKDAKAEKKDEKPADDKAEKTGEK